MTLIENALSLWDGIVWCLVEYLQMPLGQRIIGAALVLLAAIVWYAAMEGSGRARARAMQATVGVLSALSITIGVTMGHPMPEMELLFVWLPIAGWASVALVWLFNKQIYFACFKPIAFPAQLQEKMDKISAYYKMPSPTVAAYDCAKIEALSSSGRQPVLLVSMGALETLSQKEMEAVLLHEAVHLKHGDSLYKLVCTAGLFTVFAPLIALLKRRASLEQEIAVAHAIPSRSARYHSSAQRKYWRMRNLR